MQTREILRAWLFILHPRKLGLQSMNPSPLIQIVPEIFFLSWTVLRLKVLDTDSDDVKAEKAELRDAFLSNVDQLDNLLGIE